MPLHNFTVQDILSMLLAILLFSTVSIFPGYVIGWAADIFSFRRRTALAQYVMAIALSNALIPILLFLAFRFGSNPFGIGLVILFVLLWAAIQVSLLVRNGFDLKLTRGHKLALAIAGIWIAFSVILLVDVQIGQRLYFNAASYDFTTRTALIHAVTRTGIPPINPTYYPGHFERITELYYFWYILGSVVDTLGGTRVDARIALFGGISWSGLSLIATIATYLRVRNPEHGSHAWRASIIGAQLLVISGLDFIPVMAMMIAIKTMFGYLPFDARVEGWNLPIMSWLNALTWVPNHVSSMAACMMAMLALLSSDRMTRARWITNVVVAGASIGSAFGLSVWVTFTFGAFMAIWALSLLFQKDHRSLLLAIMIAGILGVLIASPFLVDILRSGGKSDATGTFPLSLYVRHFAFSKALPPGAREIVGTLLLPLNYFFELGFFFLIAVLWIRNRPRTKNLENDSYRKAEFLLLVTVAILLSFVRSTVIAFNDLGMRGWLLGQFILIVWAVDILSTSPREWTWLAPTFLRSLPNSKRINDLLLVLLIVGIMTTALEASSTRLWTILIDMGVTGVPNEITPDTNLGLRTYDARLAFEFIRDHTSQDLIIQSNPATFLDRPSGLYGTRQMVIADRTAYGVPLEIFKQMSTSIGRIFLGKNRTNWSSIDQVCSRYAIQAIVVNDTDALWSSLALLEKQRAALYSNPHYAVFACGKQK